MAENQKYDRQLRLWKAHGQAAVENANVCLINASATATETLKNLVLPGIGSFTIIDDEKVSFSDIENNFFIDSSCLNQSRAQITARLLLELNPDVRGEAIESNPATLLNSDPAFFNKFTLIICSNVREDVSKLLSKICHDNNIPLVLVKSYGFIGYLRIQVNEHKMVETNPANFLDLRLDSVWDELQQFANSFDLSKLDIPCIVILIKCVNEWIESYGSFPSSYQERNKLKELIRSKKFKCDNREIDDANFEEALVFVPESVQEILEESENRDEPGFWAIAKAVNRFVKETGALPLNGAIPDIKSDTETYVALQRMFFDFNCRYREKARRDFRRVKEILEVQHGKSVATDFEIELFCKNSASIKILRYNPVYKESNVVFSRANDAARWLEDLDNNFVFYILLVAVDAFFTRHGRNPGNHDEFVETDVSLLKKCVSEILSKWQINGSSVSDDYIQEIVRWGGCELHTIASLMGGVASQECIKIITAQNVPVYNTFVFNGMKSVGATFEL